MWNLSFILSESALNHPERVAFKWEQSALTYAQTNALANQVANGLRKLGIQQGDRVVLSCPNLLYFPIVYYGILKAGAVVVPINIMLKPQEISYHILNSGAKAFFCFTGTVDLPMISFAQHALTQSTPEGKLVSTVCPFLIEITPQLTDKPTFSTENYLTLGQLIHQQAPQFETANTAADDTAVILYTSGTTGQPKGAELTHFNLFINSLSAAEIFDYQTEDVSLIALPMFHAFAQTVQFNAAVKRGATSILVSKFLPKTVLQKIHQEKVTIFCGVPTMYWALTQTAKDPEMQVLTQDIAQHLRICCSGGAALPVKDLQEFEQAFGVEILEGYGLSEASPVVCFNRPNFTRKVGSIGFAVPYLSLKIVDEQGKTVAPNQVGELVVKGPNVMKGYYKNPEETAKTIKNHWLYTGDLATLDEKGYVTIVDRSKDLIIKSGFNVYPREIEEIAVTHPDVLQVAVIGIPTEGQGEEVKAFVVLRPEKNLEKRAFLDFLKERLAAYKIPKDVEFRTELPMNATGKILKIQLREEERKKALISKSFAEKK